MFLPPEEAHVLLEYEYENPPVTLWDWFHEPRKRNIWMTTEIIPVLQVGGRNGPGARNHCVHGKNDVVIEDVLDLHPFEYFTIKQVPRGRSIGLLISFQFTPRPQGGTHLLVTFKLDIPPAIRVVASLLCKFIVRFNILKRWKFDKLDEYIASSTRQM